ncbi:perforin-like protein 4 [Plasmodium chabaudi chabaudi]|uniref:Perforin-like protein 4 n=1 Tax=Plasmodium chabaudi chabaudi TaxID=31271 RepID=A0A1D3LDI6_PLACU|nr:perforin-like protein 4 [Plasmodium chabaudi chabaudi]
MVINLKIKFPKIRHVLILGFFVVGFGMCYDHNDETKEEFLFNNEIYNKYIGKGYDIMFGWPLPNNELNEDIGFKEEIFDTKNNIDYINENVCHKEEYFKFIEDINDVAYIALNNINIDDLNRNINPFSASIPYKGYFTDLEIKKKKYIVAENTCLHSYATYNLKESIKNINSDFLLDTEKLPILSKSVAEKTCSKLVYMYNSKNEQCIKYIKPWITFFRKYGTHVIVSAHFGGKTINTLEVPIQKFEELKIYNYKYSIENNRYLNVFKDRLLLQNILKTENGSQHNNMQAEKAEKNYDDLEKKTNDVLNKYENSNSNKINLDIKGGNNLNDDWKQLTYEQWKNSIYTNIAPIYLDLFSLSSFMHIEKKESYNNALLYYNNLFGMNQENYYYSQNIADILLDGKQITGYGKGSLILTCPDGYTKSTGFIFSFDKSIELTNKQKKEKKVLENRIKIHPCYNKGEYDTSCSYVNKNSDIITFGWIYCVKYNFIKFETIYKKNDNGSSDGKSLEIACPDGNKLGLAFKIKLDQDKNLDKIKIKPCSIGDNNKCTIEKMKNNTDYLIWGFCIPSFYQGINSLQLIYIDKDDAVSNVQGACSDIYKNEYDDIFLGFTFSFRKDLVDGFNMSTCDGGVKHCISKIHKQKNNVSISKNTEQNYVGMFLVCRNHGENDHKFVTL